MLPVIKSPSTLTEPPETQTSHKSITTQTHKSTYHKPNTHNNNNNNNHANVPPHPRPAPIPQPLLPRPHLPPSKPHQANPKDHQESPRSQENPHPHQALRRPQTCWLPLRRPLPSLLQRRRTCQRRGRAPGPSCRSTGLAHDGVCAKTED